MVNTNERRVRQVLPVSADYRSKARQDCLDSQWLVRREHPRRVRLGLIEAERSSASKGRRGWHPRRVRLGLIEARTAEQQMQPLERRIRGACASASLKHCRTCVYAVIDPLHPRRVRLGLIEAVAPEISMAIADAASEARAPRPH